MAVVLTSKLTNVSEFRTIARQMGGPAFERAAANGLNEHAAEQRRQSVTRIAAYTGVPSSRMAGATSINRAVAGHSMTAIIETKDKAIGLEEYGAPHWVRDLNPMADGVRGGSVSSMRGAEATAWNVRRQFPGTFMMGGRVVKRVGKERLPVKKLYSAMLANELSKPSRPNVSAAAGFLKLDLERRVLRHVLRVVT